MTKNILMAAAAASLIALTGCGTSLSNQQIGTGTGAVLGGVAGMHSAAARWVLWAALLPVP